MAAITESQMNGPDAMTRAMDKHGITPDVLARMLKQGLRAKITKTMKVKGLIRQDQLPKGFRVVATSGSVITQDGVPLACDGDTVIMWEEVSHDERRQNRVDAQKMRGAYPADKHELDVKGPKEIHVIYDDKPRGDESE